MKVSIEPARVRLIELLEGQQPTAGMYIRVHGDNLILGRREPMGPNGETDNSDRVRLTRLSASTYGLSVKRHTGRWERTPFSGSIEEMLDAIVSFMSHLVAPY